MTERPYPRKCVSCGQTTVEKAIIPYDAEVKHNGKMVKFHVPQLDIDCCTNCGEQFFTNETDDQISKGLKNHDDYL